MNELVSVLDYVGVAVFAASGAVKASEKEMDLVGFILTATVTGIGGGTLRDLLLGIQPVFWVTHNEYLIICLAIAVGASMLVAVLMGVMTACVGGVIRDVLCAEVPMILRREIYATAAAAGAVTYVSLQALPGLQWLPSAAGFAVALAARGAGIIWKLSLPANGENKSP